jgi:signal transduction histidine kinase
MASSFGAHGGNMALADNDAVPANSTWRNRLPSVGSARCIWRPTFYALLLGLSICGAFAASAQQDWAEFDRFVALAQSSMMSHPDRAMDAAKSADAIAARHKQEGRYRRAAATALWLKAEAFMRTSRLTEARASANQAATLAAGGGNPTALDGDIALSLARISESSGDLESALKSYQRAHTIFARLGLGRSQALVLLGLGDLYGKARDYKREIRYYQDAVQAFPKDKAIALAAANNLGYAYEQMGRYGQAIRHFEEALNIAVSLKSPVLQSSILNNLAISNARLLKLADAQRAANRALALVSKNDPDNEARFSLGAKAEIAYRRGDLRAAAADLKQVFRDIDLTKTPPEFRDTHEIAYQVYRAQANYPLSIAHLEAFKRLDDEGRALAASANLALLGAEFDFARQDLEIARLRGAELEHDVRLRKSQAEMEEVIFAGVLLVGVLLAAWFAWRHALLRRHRNTISQKNVELVKTLAERDTEMERRAVVENRLREAMLTAQQANRAKSEFLANMSHELRTPLNAIIGFSDLIRGDWTKLEKAREYAADISQAGHHLLAVLNSVLDMARIEAGKMELADGLVRLGDVVDGALAVLGGPKAYAGKTVRTLGDCDAVVRGDELRLKQIVINLVSNALKFTDEGDWIQIRVEQTSDGLDLIVEDSGKGILPEKLPVIMEPFGQAESAYARSHGGIGLGLPIVKSLIEMHGGSFGIESEYGKGTVARIHFPPDRIEVQHGALAFALPSGPPIDGRAQDGGKMGEPLERVSPTDAMGAVTPSYRFYRLGPDGGCERYEDRGCDDDKAAFSFATALHHTHDIEVWCGKRRVGRIEADRMALHGT